MMPWNALTRFQKLCWIIALLWVAIHAGAYIYSLATSSRVFQQIGVDTILYVEAGRAVAAHSPLYDMGDGPSDWLVVWLISFEVAIKKARTRRATD
jgi:hypothetical protein